MTVTYGFYDSLNGDRKYNAKQISELFDGLIRDGVFKFIGDALAVSAGGGMSVIVGTGRAWFNHTWTYNDAPLILQVDQSEIALNRVDTVVLEVNSNVDVRANTIKIVKGVPSSEPVATELVRNEFVNQYPLAHIYVSAGATEITSADIENKIGSSDCPFVIGIIVTPGDLLNLIEEHKADIATGARHGLRIGENSLLEYKDGENWLPIIAGARDYQEFMLSGTWHKPQGASRVYIDCVGGGGGGISGRKNNYGSGGGGGGARCIRLLPADMVPDTVQVIVGAGGAPNSAGGASSFGNLVFAGGGKTGEDETIGGDGGACGITSEVYDVVSRIYDHNPLSGQGGGGGWKGVNGKPAEYGGGGGGAGASTDSYSALHGMGSIYGGGGGGGGGNSNKIAGKNGGKAGAYSAGGGGAGGNTAGKAGSNGANGNTVICGSGGGGGAGNSSGAGGKGGNGGFPGGGGGGGGTGTTAGGQGGTGGNGVVRVWVW